MIALSRCTQKTTTQDWGFTAQLSYKGAVLGRGNRVTVGVAYDGHSSSFNQSEAEADLIPDDNSVGVQRTEPIETAVDVHTTQQNVGVYITDTFVACRMESRSAAIAPLSFGADGALDHPASLPQAPAPGEQGRLFTITDLRVHHPDPGVHHGPILVFTCARSRPVAATILFWLMFLPPGWSIGMFLEPGTRSRPHCLSISTAFSS